MGANNNLMIQINNIKKVIKKSIKSFKVNKTNKIYRVKHKLMILKEA